VGPEAALWVRGGGGGGGRGGSQRHNLFLSPQKRGEAHPHEAALGLGEHLAEDELNRAARLARAGPRAERARAALRVRAELAVKQRRQRLARGRRGGLAVGAMAVKDAEQVGAGLAREVADLRRQRGCNGPRSA
jgi:hypothetical protein